MAERAGTIAWEIFTGIGSRVRRMYRDARYAIRSSRIPGSHLVIMFQIIFNELSAAEMAALPKTLQLDLLAEFQILPEDLDNLDASRFGVIEREGKKLHRYRAKDYRIYFERSPEGVTVHRVLHKNTLRDFLFRSKLPMAEDDQLGKTREFWKLIEQGERTRKA